MEEDEPKKYEDSAATWAKKVGIVYCFERKVFVRMVNEVLDAMSKPDYQIPTMYSESIPLEERLTEKIDDRRNEWIFGFVGRRFRLDYIYCLKSKSKIRLCELVDDNFETLCTTLELDRSDDIYDYPRLSVDVELANHLVLFCEMLGSRFPQGGEAGNPV